VQLRQDNSQRQVQAQKIGPYLIHANAMLQCSNAELMQIIEQEQQLNPALESGDHPFEGPSGCHDCPGPSTFQCSHCPFNREGHPLSLGYGSPAPQPVEEDGFLPGTGEDPDQDARAVRYRDKWFSEAENSLHGSGDREFDPSRAHAPSSLADYLLSQMRALSTDPVDIKVAEFLVGSLDDRGYLQINFDEACAVLQTPLSAIEAGLARLQTCDPPGIGARSLQECLLLQMDTLQEQGDERQYDALAHRVLCEQWDALVQRRTDVLPRRMRVKPEQVTAALSFIKNRLAPHPAAQFRHHWDHKPDSHSQAIRPDIIIARTSTGFKVEVPGFEQIPVQINSHYKGLYESIRANGNGAVKKAPAGMKSDQDTHIVSYVERANLFLKNLQRRRSTILRIAHALVMYQQGFLETSNRTFLRPLTRTQLAEQVGLHESTISRALLHKFIQLPTQEVVPFEFFFDTGVNAKQAIAALVAEEDPAAPLSDMAITRALEDRGLPVARRTVVKYREELRIPASYLRRKRTKE
jgi:RNA polymerase sigma-54 factor